MGVEDLVVLDDHGYIVAAAGHNYKFVKRLSRQERKDWGYSSLWRIASVTGTANTKNKLDKHNHKARYPVELVWRSLKLHSDVSDIILEPFSGSGTDIIACEQLNRRCFAVERDETYCDISVARFRNYSQDAEIYLQRGEQKIPLAETGLML
ncbi:hypothetical protein AGMMS49975_28130 [Clostridia bacterium]|nr:hypothetical protein AGMMS49975_28130 [Clostridia bacterium]